MTFHKAKRFNNEVAVLLPELGIDMENAGAMKTLNIINIAWEQKYRIHEAALFVAYSYAADLYKRDFDQADKFVTEHLKPIQAEWVAEGLVRPQLVEAWKVILEKRIDAARE